MKGKISLWDIMNKTQFIVQEKTPSRFLPFKGNFPLVTPGKQILFFNGTDGKKWLEECDDWIQQILLKANRIADIENSFINYLDNKKIKYGDYLRMSGKEKEKVIKDYFCTTIIDAEDLIIKDESDYGKL
jgi:hypothetical protein